MEETQHQKTTLDWINQDARQWMLCWNKKRNDNEGLWTIIMSNMYKQSVIISHTLHGCPVNKNDQMEIHGVIICCTDHKVCDDQ